MPVKKRRLKRRVDPLAEAEAWSAVFTFGTDWFGEAADFTGLTEPSRVWPPEARPEAAKIWSAARDAAWARCSAVWARRVHDPAERALAECWAIKQYGEPESCR